jgi:MoxR-like ATPase
MMRLSLGYPDREAELAILNDNPSVNALNNLTPVLTAADFLEAREGAGGVYCHPSLKEAVADIVRDTRIHRGFTLGASPRAGLHFLDAVKALAMVKGRDFVSDEDVSTLAIPLLAHRVKLRDPRAQADKIIREICLARLEGIKTTV